jgi:RNA polymerase primary sigma factor
MEENLEKEIIKENIYKALARINEKDAIVICLRFGLNGEICHTLEYIGKLLHVGRERIRSRQYKALRKLRNIT